MALSASGLGSGLDVKSLVDQLVAAERQAPNDRLNLSEARTNREISSIGSLKSALSAFRDVVEKLSDFDEFAQRISVSSEEAPFTVETAGSAVPSSYTVEILSQASRHKVASETFTDSNSVVGYGTLTIAIGGEATAIQIDQEFNTLADIRDAINAAEDNPGISASIVNVDDGTRLVLTSSETGLENSFSLTSSGGDGGLAVLDYSVGTPGTYAEIEVAADANLTIDGFTVSSASNTVTGVIDDVTIEILEADPGNEFNFEVQYDEQSSRNLVNSFVAGYNALVGVIQKETEFDAETGSRGALLGDSLTRRIADTIRRELSSVVEDASLPFTTLADIGITTTATGTLEIDSDRLSDAFATDFDAIGRLFSTEGGIASKLLERAEPFLDSEGQIGSREDRLRNLLEDIGDSRERLDSRLESVRRRFELQFNAMDLFVSQLNTTSQFLAQQLG